MHLEMAGMKNTVSSSQNRNLREEIQKWRVVIRESGYLDSNSFCGIENNEFDPELLNFTVTAKVHQYYKTGQIFLDEEIQDERLAHPIFITPEERDRVTDIFNQKTLSNTVGE